MFDNLSLLQHINPQITQEKNDRLVEESRKEEIKKMIFDLNVESVCGPDYFTGCFYQRC